MEVSPAQGRLAAGMNFRVNEFRPIRLDSSRVPMGNADGARTGGVRPRRRVSSVCESDAARYHCRADGFRRMN